MLFTTRVEWEIKDPVLKALGKDESERTYPLIEIHLNVPLFHVDVLLPADEVNECQMWSRFLAHDIEHVKQLVKQKEVVEYSIYLETPCNSHNTVERHKVKKLSKIICGKDNAGCDVDAYIFVDGDSYVNGDIDTVDAIKNAKVTFDINEMRRQNNVP